MSVMQWVPALHSEAGHAYVQGEHYAFESLYTMNTAKIALQWNHSIADTIRTQPSA